MDIPKVAEAAKKLKEHAEELGKLTDHWNWADGPDQRDRIENDIRGNLEGIPMRYKVTQEAVECDDDPEDHG